MKVGLQFVFDKVNAMRDEVLAEWRTNHGFLFLCVYVYVDGQFGPVVSSVRDAIFRREMPLALEATRYGDRKFFAVHSVLDNVPIWIHFDSTNPEYNRFENWGTPKDYK